jgi:hypothetical protein
VRLNEPATAADADGDPHLEVIDALGGFCRIERRSPTLGGSVPLRVAQGCLPLLEGNAFGLQLTLPRPIVLHRRLGRYSLDPGSLPPAVPRALAASLPMLAAQGFLERDGHWLDLLRKGIAVAGPRSWPSARAGVRLWTGLLARPKPGLWLRLSSTANRRSVLFDVAEVVIPDSDRFVPLIADITPASFAGDEIRIEGEIATLSALQPGASFTLERLEDAAAIGEAHLDFYDAAYFATKKKEVTRKYRRMALAEGEDPPRSGAAPCHVIDAGPANAPSRLKIGGFDRCLLPDGEASSIPARYGRFDVITFENEIDFTACYDGHALAIRWDRAELAARADALQTRWIGALGRAPVEAQKGALLYLTKYFSPHPPGEPHFFVKPWAFTQTPPGWSSLLEGIHGPGYDILRGVVRTDMFFATPAVFHLFRPGEAIRVAEGQPLLRVLPLPRALLEPTFELRSLLALEPQEQRSNADG